MKVQECNFLLVQIDLNGLPDVLDWTDARKLEVTAIMPGAVRIRDVVKTILPGMDPNGIIPTAKIYAKAPAGTWAGLRAEWETHLGELIQVRSQSGGKIIAPPVPFGTGRSKDVN